MARPKRQSKCHPDRPNYSGGVCRKCYKKEHNLVNRYGLTELEVETILNRQGGKCALYDQTKSLVIDHDHLTGRVRGLLCYRCNNALGGYEILVGKPRIKTYLDPEEDS